MMNASYRTNREPKKNTPRSFGKESLFEIIAVIVTGVFHLMFADVFVLRVVFAALVILGWGTYVTIRVRSDRSVLKLWGFHTGNLREALAASSVVALIGALVMVVIAVSRGNFSVHWDMLLLFFLYPIWGCVQQFWVQALVAGNLSTAPGRINSPWAVTLITACLFSAVHLPDLESVGGTFLLGLAFTPIYLRWRNLWPLGLYHGWLGTLGYFWVLGRAPWVEVLQ